MDDTCVFPRFECYLVRLKPKPCSCVFQRSPTGMMYQLCSIWWNFFPVLVALSQSCPSVLCLPQRTAGYRIALLILMYHPTVVFCINLFADSLLSHPVFISRHLAMIVMLITYQTDVKSVIGRSVANIAEVFRLILAWRGEKLLCSWNGRWVIKWWKLRNSELIFIDRPSLVAVARNFSSENRCYNLSSEIDNIPEVSCYFPQSLQQL
jgi:hypothetical protein